MLFNIITNQNHIAMRKSIFLLLAVVMTAVILSACQKDEVLESPAGLYLKSATAGDVASTYYIEDEAGKLVYPNNLLFFVSEEAEAKVLNNFLLKVEDFNLLSEEEALFRISEFNSKPIIISQVDGKNVYAPNSENVYAEKLPLISTDYGKQAATGNERFNGLLKADDHVIAVNGTVIKVYSLKDKSLISASGSIQEDVLILNIPGEAWDLRFVKNSPIGNIFQLTIGDEVLICYTLF